MLKRKPNLFPAVLFIAAAALQMCVLLHGCAAPMAREPVPPETLYSRKCASCHRLIEPAEHPPHVWRRYVQTYGKAMSPAQRQMLTDYLEGEADKTRK